mmetsp:Transcript_15449/g.25248  ORF Transcript_15449/g.25248 Transcript_15449/m.25248 type:complete len:265 (+) Transcript_15449:428-1222(+)|eukprot:CAMPEP_0203744014 /NCGR_PEP_ID=MMETSP0098-20131031/225_1 /ASSEMBLY_ACC=CAM_ASM_000208 /TAXON_ID=96639 /ORGANISM=" , Strain NY0313808BC1" /LENGTH=264 /DNA_ID=CAMNT_0050631423 /DNA_START=455 /DNA_END=1249 /DNA_ORIENTATION=-
MKVAELREQLRVLGLSTSGRKNDLIMRLNGYLGNRMEGGAVKRARCSQGPMDGKRIKMSTNTRRLALEKTFETYKQFDHDEIGAEGMMNFCNDIQVDPEDPVMVALSWSMGAANLGVYTREEFFRGMEKLGCASAQELVESGKMALFRNYLTNIHRPEFLEIYRYAYGWACEPDQKSLSKEVAVHLWPLLLRPLNFELLDEFLKFVEVSGSKGVTRDLWIQVYHFIVAYKSANNSFSFHDPDNSAWPVVIDEFIEHVSNNNSML